MFVTLDSCLLERMQCYDAAIGKSLSDRYVLSRSILTVQKSIHKLYMIKQHIHTAYTTCSFMQKHATNPFEFV